MALNLILLDKFKYHNGQVARVQYASENDDSVSADTTPGQKHWFHDRTIVASFCSRGFKLGLERLQEAKATNTRGGCKLGLTVTSERAYVLHSWSFPALSSAPVSPRSG